MSEAGSEPLEAGSAEGATEPEAGMLKHAPLGGQMPWAPLFADLLQSPLPMAPPQPTTEAGLIETSGRLHLDCA